MPVVPQDTMALMAFSPDGSAFTYGVSAPGREAAPQRFTVWDLHRDRARTALDLATPQSAGAVVSVSLGRGGRTLAVGGDAGTLQIWDTATQQPLGGPLTTPGENITTLAFSHDNATLYAGSAHVPLQRYAIAPSRAVDRICARVGTR